MIYKGNVDRGESLDPRYKVVFSYRDERLILDGEAFFIRKSPFPEVCFSDHTDYLIEKYEVDSETIKNIKLEIGKTVFDHMMNSKKG